MTLTLADKVMPNTNDPEVRMLRRVRQNIVRRVHANEITQAQGLAKLHAAIPPRKARRK